MRALAAVVVSALALPVSLQEKEPASTDAGNSAANREPVTVHDTAREPEEVIVRPHEWEPSLIRSAETMQHIYDLRGRGACLYNKGRYAEAFPYLRAAARAGFKLAQARLAFLYGQGLGTDRDPYAAIGWYGVAAEGTTLPEIRNGFRRMLRRIPPERRSTVSALVDEYKANYGADMHRVECDLSARAGTFLKMLTCRFRDAGAHINHGPLLHALGQEMGGDESLDATPLINEVEAAGVLDNPYPTSTPLRAGSSGC